MKLSSSVLTYRCLAAKAQRGGGAGLQSHWESCPVSWEVRFTLSQEELEWGGRDIHSHLLGPFLSLGMETLPSGLGDMLIDNDNSERQLL